MFCTGPHRIYSAVIQLLCADIFNVYSLRCSRQFTADPIRSRYCNTLLQVDVVRYVMYYVLYNIYVFISSKLLVSILCSLQLHRRSRVQDIYRQFCNVRNVPTQVPASTKIRNQFQCEWRSIPRMSRKNMNVCNRYIHIITLMRTSNMVLVQ